MAAQAPRPSWVGGSPYVWEKWTMRCLAEQVRRVRVRGEWRRGCDGLSCGHRSHARSHGGGRARGLLSGAVPAVTCLTCGRVQTQAWQRGAQVQQQQQQQTASRRHTSEASLAASCAGGGRPLWARRMRRGQLEGWLGQQAGAGSASAVRRSATDEDSRCAPADNPTPRPPSAHPGPATPGPYLAAPPTCVIWRAGGPRPRAPPPAMPTRRARDTTPHLSAQMPTVWTSTPPSHSSATRSLHAGQFALPRARPSATLPSLVPRPPSPSASPAPSSHPARPASLHLRTPRPLACATLGSLRVHARDAPLASAALSWTYPSHHARLVSPRCLSNVVPDVG